MHKSLSLLLFLIAFTGTKNIYPQQLSASKKPKLIVGIVIDQMRNEFIYRYWDRFGKNGFKRLVKRGYYFRNAHFNYIPTYTGPGHASIYTGATPRAHGIIGNDWISHQNGNKIYCVADSSVKPVGSENKKHCRSPLNLLCTTIGDEMKLSSSGRSKVLAVSIKDRGAILPAGHKADGAFWYDDESGRFVTSSWYTNDLPDWVKKFNDRKLASDYMANGWNTIYPVGTYTNSLSDDNPFETLFPGQEKPVFPYDFSKNTTAKNLSVLKATPHGNSLVREFAAACLLNSGTGEDEIPDLLSISFSAADVITHDFGPRSVENEDMYLRLDLEIAELLRQLDKKVGRKNYVVFLTGDHGGAEVPAHLQSEKMPGGYIYEKYIRHKLRMFTQQIYGDSLIIRDVYNEQVYFDRQRLIQAGLDRDGTEKKLCEFLIDMDGIAEAYPSAVIKYGAFTGNDHKKLMQNGFNHKLSGNICLVFKPGWLDYGPKGSTHGSGYVYDTHVPLIFYGKGIDDGAGFYYVSITQIVPTLCEILGINRPACATDEPLSVLFDDQD